MAETQAGRTLKGAILALGGHMQRIETKTSPGVPDASVTLDGHDIWMEAKHITRLPMRVTTDVRLDHPLTPEQRNWIEARQRAGGRAVVWVRIGGANGGWMVFEHDLTFLMHPFHRSLVSGNVPNKVFKDVGTFAQHIRSRLNEDVSFGRPLWRDR